MWWKYYTKWMWYIVVLYYVLFVVYNLLFVGGYLINHVTMQIMQIILIYYALFYFAICKFKKCINASCASSFYAIQNILKFIIKHHPRKDVKNWWLIKLSEYFSSNIIFLELYILSYIMYKVNVYISPILIR